MQDFDVAIVGAGAAGLFCAGIAGQLGLRVLLLDHAPKLAEKIRISGGGRCNFTNRDTGPANFLSANPRFARSALSRYTPKDFCALLQRHAVPYHEKHRGQLFCDRSAQDVIDALLAECGAGQVARWQPCKVQAIRSAAPAYALDTERGSVACRALVIATGGLSIPQLGASDFGLRVATQFGLPVVATHPGLVPLTFDASDWDGFEALAGLSLPVHAQTGDKKNGAAFHEDLLFTHRGLSGPGALQISSYWRSGSEITLNLAPELDLYAALQARKATSRRLLVNELATWIPARLAEHWVARGANAGQDWSRAIDQTPDKALRALDDSLRRWRLLPSGTEGYRKAEVMAGGVDTHALSGQTLESRQSGLYFIGEVVDVTGWLGGYNFQWAWSSAFACAHALAAKLLPGA